MPQAIELDRFYPHAPDRVWAAISSAEALAAWLMPNDFEPRIGHRFCFRTDPAPGFDGVVHCEVLELEAPRTMVWSWRGGPVDTTVTFELVPLEGGTQLRFSQAGFDGLHQGFVRLILQSGFRKMMRGSLPAVIEQLASGQPPTRPVAEPRRGLGARVEHAVARLFARK